LTLGDVAKFGHESHNEPYLISILQATNQKASQNGQHPNAFFRAVPVKEPTAAYRLPAGLPVTIPAAVMDMKAPVPDPKSYREEVVQVSADIKGTMCYPTGSAKGKEIDALVMCHGFTGTQLQGGIWPRVAHVLAVHGFATLRFDFRFGNAKDYVSTTYASQVADVRTAFEWLAARPGFDATRLGVVGMSQGGIVSTMFAATEPRLKALILFNPVTNPVITYQSLLGGFDALKAAAVENRGLVWAMNQYHVGAAFVQDLFRCSAAAELARVRTRTLIVVSTGDPLIPQPMSVESLVQYHAGPTTAVLMPGSDHMFSVFLDESQRFIYSDVATAWVIKFLAG